MIPNHQLTHYTHGALVETSAYEPSAVTPDSTNNASRWTIWRIVGYVVLVAVAFLVSQFLGAMALLIVEMLRDPTFEVREWMDRSQSSGSMAVAASIASTLICVPLVIALVASRETDRWRFLRIQKASARSFFVWCAALAALLAVSDLLTISLGRPIVPDVMVEMFSSTHPLGLLLALVLCAPLFEELFFRGFLLSAMEAVGARPWVAAVTSAAFWSALHLQYDLYGIVSIFAMGLLLAAARFSTNSILPCVAMHSLANLVAHVETAFLARAGA